MQVDCVGVIGVLVVVIGTKDRSSGDGGVKSKEGAGDDDII